MSAVLTTGAHRASCSWVVKVTFKLRLVSRCRMRGVLPLCSYSPSARDKYRNDIIIALTLYRPMNS